MRLQDLQRAFQARVLAYTPGIERELNGPASDEFDARLETYVGGYRTRLVGALAATYPVLQMTLGEEEFSRQTGEYIEANPSHHYSVREYGAGIGRRFSTATSGEQGAILGELARWEWTLADVFDAPDDDALDMATVSGFAPEVWPMLNFTLRASLRRFETSTNIVEWWRAANGLCTRPTALSGAATSRWMLWRRGVKTFFRSLDVIEAEALDTVRAGLNFGELCELLANRVGEPQAAFQAASLLRGWIAEELVAGCSVPIGAG